jgi:glycosyltransferase involved in cell wall biosynthesis
MMRHVPGHELVEAPDQGPPEKFFRHLGCVPNLRTAYGWPAFRRELWLAERLADESGVLLHFLNGESACYLTPRFKGQNRILATYHQPPSFMKEIIPDKSHFPLHDGVVVISPNQVEYFESLTGAGKVHLVPLGVAPGHFPFGHPENRVRRCLFVGNWLRDFDTLVETVRIIKKQDPGVEVAVVTPKKNHHLFTGIDVSLMTGVPTEDLLELYRTSAAFIFPVSDCTGNTALLEAMCSGLPVVTNQRALFSGYLNEECCRMVGDGDAEAFAREALELVYDSAHCARQSEAGRQWVTDWFSWERIVDIQKRVYARYGWSG